MDSVKRFELFYILLKRTVSDKTILFLIFLFPFIVSLITISIIPLSNGGGVVMTLTIMPIIMIIFSNLVFTVKGTTFFKNYEVSGGSNLFYYFCVLLITLFFAFISTCILLLYFKLFEFTGLLKLMGFYEDFNPDKYVDLSLIDYGLLTYYIILMVVTIYAFMFMLRKIINTQKFFAIFLTTFIILGIFYSGSVLNYFNGAALAYDYENNIRAFMKFDSSFGPNGLYGLFSLFPFLNIGHYSQIAFSSCMPDGYQSSMSFVNFGEQFNAKPDVNGRGFHPEEIQQVLDSKLAVDGLFISPYALSSFYLLIGFAVKGTKKT